MGSIPIEAFPIWNTFFIIFVFICLCCFADHKIRVWDVTSGRSAAVLNHHSAEVCGLVANFDTNKFVSSAFDGKVLYPHMYQIPPSSLILPDIGI
jgi:WD40 repeat protein